MNWKKFITSFLAFLTIALFFGVLSMYLYAKKMEPINALKQNILLFNKLDKLESYSTENINKGKGEIKINYLGQEFEDKQDINEKSYTNINVAKKEVVFEPKLKIRKTFDDYLKGDIFSDLKRWDELFAEKKLTIKDNIVNNKNVWEYTITDKTLSDDILKSVKDNFINELNYNTISSQKAQNIQINTSKDLVVTLQIDKNTNHLISSEFKAEAPIYITFEITDNSSGKEEIAKGTYTASNVFAKESVNKLNFKPGEQVFSNSLMLWFSVLKA